MRSPTEAIRAFEERERLGKSPSEGYNMVGAFTVDTPANAKAYLSGLESKHWRVVLGCLKTVGRRASFPELFIPRLITLLSHQSTSVQGEAARVLAAYGDDANEAVGKMVDLSHKVDLLVGEEFLFALCAIPAGRSSAQKFLLAHLQASFEGEAWCSDYLIRPSNYEPYGAGSLNIPKLEQVCHLLGALTEHKEQTLATVSELYRQASWSGAEEPEVLMNVKHALLNVFIALGCEGHQSELMEFLDYMTENGRPGFLARRLLFLHPNAWDDAQGKKLRALISQT